MQLIYIFGITLEGEIPTSYIKYNAVQKYLRRTNPWTILAPIFMREKKLHVVKIYGISYISGRLKAAIVSLNMGEKCMQIHVV